MWLALTSPMVPMRPTRQPLIKLCFFDGSWIFPSPTLLDTKGPEIRIGQIKGGSAELNTDQIFTFTTRDIEGDSSIASITYKDLPADMQVGGIHTH